jgi:hypothetical protein
MVEQVFLWCSVICILAVVVAVLIAIFCACKQMLDATFWDERDSDADDDEWRSTWHK